MKKTLFITLLIPFLSLSLLAQDIKIHKGQEVISTQMIGTSSEGIYTSAGTFRFSDIQKVVFASFDEKLEETYFVIAAKTKVEFEDGAKLENLEEFESRIIQAKSPAAPNSTMGSYDISPGEYLERGSNSALVGVALTVIGPVVSILTESTIPAVVGGALGLALQIDGWSKVGKAGKQMQEEKRLERLERLKAGGN